MILHDIKNAEHLSASEQAVAAYILLNPENVVTMDIRGLADAAFVSTATVIRFCRKMNIKNFQSLKLQIASDLSKHPKIVHIDSDASIPASPSDTAEEILDNILGLRQNVIQETRSLQDTQMWEKVIEQLAQARQIDLYGLSYSLDSAVNFRSNMLLLGYSVFMTQDIIRQRHQACNAHQGCFAIILSYSGRTEQNLLLARILKKKGVPILAITSEGENPLKEMATWNIPLAILKKDSYYNHTAIINTCVEMSYVLDCLFAGVFRYDYEGNKRRIEEDQKLQREMEK